MDFSPETLLAPYAQDADTPNSPYAFLRLSPAKQKALQRWIALAVTHAGKAHPMTSYGMKHDFEAEGFYATNGEFKGAMLVAGYDSVSTRELNWRFRVAPAVRRTFQKLEGGDHHTFSIGRFDMEYFNLLRTALGK